MSVNVSLISSRQVIARTLDSFKIDTADWIPRAALWIQDAMFDMKLVRSYSIVELKLDVEEYKVQIPDGCRQIEAVAYNGKRLRRLDQINVLGTTIEDLNIATDTYEITNGYLLFGFETGEASIYFRSLPLEVAAEGAMTGVLYPMIPDNFDLMEALEFYILLKLLQKGYRHPVFSLDSNNEVTNAYYRWKEARKKAQNSVTALSFDERRVISYEIKTMVHFDEYPDKVLFRDRDSNLLNYGSFSGDPLAPPEEPDPDPDPDPDPILVTGITVTSADEVANGSSLQMYVLISPENADDKTITWSVVSGTGTATISTSGLLTATGEGTVDVIATANDGSEVAGSKTVTVTAFVPLPEIFNPGGYGLLYNHFAASEDIAPVGTRVATIDDFSTLAAFLEGFSFAGARMKNRRKLPEISEHPRWNDNVVFLSPDSGFEAVGGGYRSDVPHFNGIGSSSYFYTKNKETITLPGAASGMSGSGEDLRLYGRSLRCIVIDPSSWTLGDTYTDYDNNTYTSVKIGNQVWLRENLKTKHYNTGAAISHFPNDADWIGAIAGAYCAYNNDDDLV